MKRRALLFCFVLLGLHQLSAAEGGSPFSGEFTFEQSFIGRGNLQRGFRRLENFEENSSVARLVLTPRTKLGILRLGAEWERFTFGFHGRSQLPSVLQSFSVIVGLDTQFSDSILFRIEAQPGLYGTSIDTLKTDDFNVPLVIGGTYIYNSDLQLVLGLGVDVNRKYPVLPGGGVRWKIARQWVLNAVLPTPQLEFELNKSVTLRAGANLKGSTYRTSDNFGQRSGDRRLNSAVLAYTEVRAGVGIDWKLSSNVTLSADGGYVPFREFDYHRTNVRYHEEGGAPYASLSLHGAF